MTLFDAPDVSFAKIQKITLLVLHQKWIILSSKIDFKIKFVANFLSDPELTNHLRERFLIFGKLEHTS